MKVSTAAFLALTALSGGVVSPVWAGDRNSMEDQIACTPDVYRLCGQYVPNEDAIVQCLQRNIRVLSPDCHRVFSQPPSKNNDDD